MRIMVFDVPAEKGGALSVLNDLYTEVSVIDDKSINWVFVLSTPKLEEKTNIKVLRFPWIKKSWMHRYFFDNVIAPKLVKQYDVDKVFSLQNVIIPHTNCEQILYVHQPLPFVDYKFTLKDNKVFWIYQNIIGKKILSSIKKSQKVIVQTNWMKEACLEKTLVNRNKIEVISPQINLDVKKSFTPNDDSLSTFFYPASGTQYKNHQVIIDACRELKKLANVHYKIMFTLNGNENEYVSSLYKQVQNEELPISFIGSKTRSEVFDLYIKSILLFPSYIETFGLPMLEARLHKGIILASDCPFSHEILNDYDNAHFFNPFDSKQLSQLMARMIGKNIQYKNFKSFNSANFKQELKLINVIL